MLSCGVLCYDVFCLMVFSGRPTVALSMCLVVLVMFSCVLFCYVKVRNSLFFCCVILYVF